MKRYLRPWVKFEVGEGHLYEWNRSRLSNGTTGIDVQVYTSATTMNDDGFDGWAYAYFNIDESRTVLSSLSRDITFDTDELAMAACDKELIEHGYELLTEERCEKLMLLL